MFHELCGDVEIYFDDAAKAIVIEEKYALLFYMNKTERRRLATFTDERSWNESRYSRMADNYIAEMAMWFWIDLETHPTL
jgi:hypothetical protein